MALRMASPSKQSEPAVRGRTHQTILPPGLVKFPHHALVKFLDNGAHKPLLSLGSLLDRKTLKLEAGE